MALRIKDGFFSNTILLISGSFAMSEINVNFCSSISVSNFLATAGFGDVKFIWKSVIHSGCFPSALNIRASDRDGQT